MKALIVTTDDFEDSECSYPYYRLKEAEWDVNLATPDGGSVTGKIGIEFDADSAITDHSPDQVTDEFDLLVIPGGRAPEYLRLQAPETADIIRAFDTSNTPIASICHGAQLLISADILQNRRLTGYWSLKVDIENAGGEFGDEEVVVDDNLITARVPDDLPAFLRTVFEVVEQRTVTA